MQTRKPIPEDTQHRVFDRSRRRCALCAHFDNDYTRKEGQLAHIDRDPSNAAEENLVYLCLPHHDDYDTKRRQTKNLTEREAKTARNRLYDFIEHGGDLAAGPQRPKGTEADQKTLAEIQALMAQVPDYFLSQPDFGGCSFSAHEIEAFRAMVERRNKAEHEFIDTELEELRWQFISAGQVLLGVMEKRLVPASQQGWYRLPIEWRESAPDRLEWVARALDQQAAKAGLAYHTLIRAARRKLEN
jgi:hypothetical protein